LLTNFLQIHRLPFRRGHRQTVLPTRVQRVGIRCAAISDGCVAVLELNRRLVKRQCRTPYATFNKQASRQAIRQRGPQSVTLLSTRSPWDTSTSRACPPESSHVIPAPSRKQSRRTSSWRHHAMSAYMDMDINPVSTTTNHRPLRPFIHRASTDRVQLCTLHQQNHAYSAS
jgi:hypothetical protein